MLKNYKCENEKMNLDDYLKLYKYVRDNMIHPEWLGTFTKEEIEEILLTGGKIWLYYDNKNLVCSMFYMPIEKKILLKHNVDLEENWFFRTNNGKSRLCGTWTSKRNDECFSKLL